MDARSVTVIEMIAEKLQANASLKLKFLNAMQFNLIDSQSRVFNDFVDAKLCDETYFTNFVDNFMALLKSIPSTATTRTAEGVVITDAHEKDKVYAYCAQITKYACTEFLDSVGRFKPNFKELCMLNKDDQKGVCLFLSAYTHHIIQSIVHACARDIPHYEDQYNAAVALFSTQRNIWTAHVLRNQKQCFDAPALDGFTPLPIDSTLLKVVKGGSVIALGLSVVALGFFAVKVLTGGACDTPKPSGP